MASKKGRSIYQTIAKEITDSVSSGEYVKGQRLPSEIDLALQFDVSRLTIRKAINLLIDTKVLYKQENKGTYVMSHQKLASGESGLQGFNEVAISKGKKPKTELLETHQLEFDQTIWQLLEAQEDEQVIVVKRVRYLDDVPMTFEELYLRQKYLPKELTDNAFSGSIFDLFEQKVAIAYSHQEIEAVLVDDKLSDIFDISQGQPMFKVKSTVYTVSGLPIIYDISHYRSDEYVFATTLIRHQK